MLFANADESEGVSATNFGFMNESLDVPWPCIYWKKGNAIKGVCVRVLELQGFMFRERDSILCIPAFKKAVLIICW